MEYEETKVEETPEQPEKDSVVETPETPEPKEETPEEPVENQLFELPDGRKVDANTLSKEWKENFLPEFTRKSQKLSEYEKPKETLKEPSQVDPLDPYSADPDYVPKSYKEIEDRAMQKALREFKKDQDLTISQEKALEDAVTNQLKEVETLDPAVNKNALFLHATKYRFSNLTDAYQNMKDMKTMTKKVQDTTVKNISKRNDPVSTTPGATGAVPDPSVFSSAVDYFRSIK